MNLKALQKQHDEVRKEASLDPKKQRVLDEADDSFNEITSLVEDFDSEDRVRKAGFTPQQAEDIAYILKTKQVGEIFSYRDKQLVLTPFKTVVDAQVYLSLIQDRFLELTSVPAEVEIADLKKTINKFTSLSFFGLIKLAFKRLRSK